MGSAATFDHAAFANVFKTVEEAETLPPWCYTSAEFYAREIDRIFLKCWQFVGRSDEIPEPEHRLRVVPARRESPFLHEHAQRALRATGQLLCVQPHVMGAMLRA